VRLTDRRLEGLVVVVADKTAWSVDPSALLRPGPSGAVVVGVAAPSSPSTLFDEDVRSDSVPRFLLLLAMSNCSRIPRDVALRVVS